MCKCIRICIKTLKDGCQNRVYIKHELRTIMLSSPLDSLTEFLIDLDQTK